MARKWTRTARNILSSLADVAGDWLFWYFTVRDNPELKDYDIPVMVFAGISAFFCLWTIYGEFCKCRCKSPKGERGFLTLCWDNKSLLAEIIFEDIGQIVLSVLVTLKLSRWTPTSTLNLATSIYNLVLDVLDIAEGDDFFPFSSSRRDDESGRSGSYRASPY